jgi:Tfp pilus assembly protein PilV
MFQTTHPAAQDGQTLIEVLVAALVVALLSASVATGLISTAHASGDQRLRATADTLAAQDQERMRGLSDEQLSDLAGTGQIHTATVSGVTYSITSSTQAVDASGRPSCSGAGAADFRTTSQVSFERSGGGAQDQVSADSLIARPTTGDLLAVVTDQLGAGVSGVTVAAQATGAVSGVGQQTAITDGTGCALFAGLASGGYQVTFAKTGYVDPTGNPSPSLTVPVSATGTPTANQISLAPAGTINAALTTTSGAAGDADALSYSSVGQATPAATSTSGTGASTLSAPNLYPFQVGQATPPSYTGNYTVWAGACPEQKPPSPTTATVLPGAPASVSLRVPSLNLSTLTVGGLPVTPTAFSFTFAGSSGCSDTWTAQAATTLSGTTGWLADPGQPYSNGTTGSLSVCVTYRDQLGRTGYGTALLRANSSFAAAPPARPLTLSAVTRC